MLEDDFLRAAYPLFQAGVVEVLEWSFDCGWPPAVVPEWADGLLRYYSDAQRLLGHGVSYSALSAGVEPEQDAWLANLETEVRRRSYHHISEHFGFSRTPNFHQSAPLPVPLNDATLKLGQDRLRRLSAVAKVPVGLENLAFAFHRRDVDALEDHAPAQGRPFVGAGRQQQGLGDHGLGLAAEQELAQAKGTTQDKGNGLSVSTQGYLNKELSGVGDQAFCTTTDLAGSSGVLVRTGDKLVYVSVGMDNITPPSIDLNAAQNGQVKFGSDDKNCEVAQKIAAKVS